MPDVIQRALSALWRLLLALGIFGVGYIVWNAQDDTASTFLVPCSWFLYCYILYFPSSPPAIFLARGFDLLDDERVLFFVPIFATLLLFYSIYRHSPFGMLYIVALGFMNFCHVQRLAYRADANADARGLPEPTRPDAAAAEDEGSDNNTPDTCQEASRASEQEEASKPEQSNSAKHCGTTPEVGATKPRARGVMRTLWSFLCLILMLGLCAVVTKVLIDALFKELVNTAPTDGSPLFEAEVIVANKTELSILVPLAEFIPTGVFGSPCQAAPTPTPIAKSTQAWIGTAMSTTMPTPIPTPSPSDTPQLEPVPVPIKPNDALNRLFDFDLPDPTPVLKWYLNLPTESQYTVIVISLLLLWCLSKPLIILAAHIAVLAIAYFVSAAVIALLLLYGFTDEQSIAIALPAGCALIVSIWWAYFWLKNLANASTRNAADHMQLSGLFEQSLTSISQWMGNTDGSIDVLVWRVDKCKEWVVRLLDELSAQAMFIKEHQSRIKSLVTRKAYKADLHRMTKIIRALSARLDGFEDFDGDADTLGTAQEELSNLNICFEELRAGKADAADLEQVRKDLEELVGRFNNLETTRVDSPDFESLSEQLQALVRSFDEVRNATLQHGASISNLDKESEMSKEAIDKFRDQVTSDKNEEADKMTNLEQEIAKVKKENADVKQENDGLRKDVDRLRDDMDELKKTIEAMQASQVTQKDLQVLRKDVTSDADREVKTLRSETNSQLAQVTRDHKNLEGKVDRNSTDSSNAVENLRDETETRHDALSGKQDELRKHVEERIAVTQNVASGVQNDFDYYKGGVNLHFGEVSARIDSAISKASSVEQLVQDVESRLTGSIAELQADEEVRSKVEKFMQDFLVSDKFWAAVNEAQLTLKKQSQRERLRDQVQAAMEELLETEDIQENIYANLKERQALNSPQGGSPAVVSDGRASPDDVEPPTSPAASDNTTGNDGPLGDSPGVINGGRATLPGDMSSDDTTNPIIPEESTIPDDVDDHHGTRGVPPGEPPGANLRGRSTSLAGSTSDGASGDGGTGSRPSGESDDDTLQPKQWEAKEPREPGHLTSERAHDPDNQAQPGGEQDEETDEEKTDGDADDDADDDSDDDDPSDPPPGSGGFHGHDGAGDGGDGDDEDGDHDGAPRPFTGCGASRSAPGLASSRYASGPLSGSGDLHGNNRTGGNNDGAHDRDGGGAPGPFLGLGDSRHNTGPSSGASNPHNQNDGTGAPHNNGAQRKPKKPFENASETQKLRRSKQYEKLKAKQAAKKEKKRQDNQKKQEQNEPTQPQNPPAQRQPQPIQRQGQAIHWQNGPTYGQGQPVYWQSGPGRQNQPMQRHNQPSHWQNQPTHIQNQQTGEGQEQ